MKKLVKSLLFPLLALTLTGCPMPWEKDTDEMHYRYYDGITGKFVLHDQLDNRTTYTNTYFEFDGSKGVFSAKYYENGELKMEGKFEKINTYKDRIGKWANNLHLNIHVGDHYDHISTYTESFEPLNQFRILEEYKGFDDRYFLSELPYVMGTYVREGAEYKAEAYHTNTGVDYAVPTEDNFTSSFNGTYKLDNDHYFYFVCPNGWSLPDGPYYYDAFFQYFAPTLEKPLEGFVTGHKVSELGLYIKLSYVRHGVDWGKYPEQELYLGYPYRDAQDILDYTYGSVDFSDGELKSFTFEKISRSWSEAEWGQYIKKGIDLPDPVQYDYVGGTYIKA